MKYFFLVSAHDKQDDSFLSCFVFDLRTNKATPVRPIYCALVLVTGE